MNTVLIRCAASLTVGFGHLVRCRVLARELKNKGFFVIMVGPPTALNSDDDKDLFLHWIVKEEWSTSPKEADFHLKLLQKYESKHIIIDDYRSDGEHQKILRENGIRIVQQYDASKKQNFAANIVVNGSPFERADFYIKDAQYDDIEFLLGPKYSILRPIFSSGDIKGITQQKNILMTFGGGSDRGIICFILDNYEQQIVDAGWTVTIVVGEKNDSINAINSFINGLDHRHIKLIVNPKNMAEIMVSCSFAIMGGGTTIFEAAYLGIPALLIPIADNQVNQCIGWENLGGMKYISTSDQFDNDKFQEDLNLLLNDSQVLEMKRQELLTVIDADGYKRILDKLIKGLC